jgi:hypothetical protein
MSNNQVKLEKRSHLHGINKCEFSKSKPKENGQYLYTRITDLSVWFRSEVSCDMDGWLLIHTRCYCLSFTPGISCLDVSGYCLSSFLVALFTQ